jgi:hypothetical protein
VTAKAMIQQCLAEQEMSMSKRVVVWAMKFTKRVLVVTTGMERLRGAASHQRYDFRQAGIYSAEVVEGGLVQFDYTKPCPKHFVWEGKRDTIKDRQQ